MATKSTTAARPALNIVLETEKNIKEKKWYPVRYRPFHPNLSEKPLTGKFYARHDFFDKCISYKEIEKAIKRKHVSNPKDRTDEPETENQEYGWYLQPLVLYDKSDNRFFHPKISSWITQIGAIIDIETRKVPKKPFAGIPFKF